jgi:hypothetical protein
MKKILFAIPILLLGLISIANADVVRTTTGYIWTNITFDNRTLVDWDFYVYNDSYSITGGSAVISNLERKNMFLVFKIIPTPAGNCFANYQNCPTTGFDTKINVSYSRPATMESFWTGDIKYTSNWGGGVVDVSSCWNWWNDTSPDKRDAQQMNCPTIAIKVDDKAEACNLLLQTSSPSGATPNYIARLEGYSSNYVDIDTKVSPPIVRFVQSVVDFEDISVSIWRIFYLALAIAIVLCDIVLVIGILPLGLRWVIKKVTGD